MLTLSEVNGSLTNHSHLDGSLRSPNSNPNGSHENFSGLGLLSGYGSDEDGDMSEGND